MKRLILTVLTILAFCQAWGQTSREDIYANPNLSAGLHCAYPGPQGTGTKAPKGYKPFYISHFSRHGSRYLIDMDDYTKTIDDLKGAQDAGVLTDLGKDVLERMKVIWEDARQHDGELTRLGVEQHRGIAERMFRDYPQVFRKGAYLTARSTQVPRCMLSMDAFCERLKELNPSLNISRDASLRDKSYISSRSKEFGDYMKANNVSEGLSEWRRSCVHPDRLVASLISSQEYIDGHIDKAALMRRLYNVAGIMQNVDLDVDLYDIFTKEELYDLWRSGNVGNYASTGPNKNGGEMMYRSSLALLKNMIETADEAIATGSTVATLRFSHDSYLLPLCTTLRLSDCMGSADDWDGVSAVWSNYKVSPMAGNVQIIFFRNKSGDVIVKFLHNEVEVGIPVETDMYPFYRWEDVKAYYIKTYDYNNARL